MSRPMTPFLKCLLVSCHLAGCAWEYERTYSESKAEYEERVSVCSDRAAAGEYILTLVDTDRWQLGAIPFWSTSERIREILGSPYSTSQGLDMDLGPSLSHFVYQRSGGGSDGRVVLTVINDSLAYLSIADLGTEPLSTNQGKFELGTPLSEVREAFPESYECRDWAGIGGPYLDQYDPVLAVTDTTRGANVLFVFRDEKLLGVRTDYYLMDIEHQTTP